ncbi:hypothetical protein HDU98_005922, partial [Podochytrium sp. JEL0797]
ALSAAELHGAPPTVSSFLNELKALPSLHNCPSIDAFMALFVDQSRQKDSFSIRKRIFHMQKHKYAIFETAGERDMIDQMKAIEILHRMKSLNQGHIVRNESVSYELYVILNEKIGHDVQPLGRRENQSTPVATRLANRIEMDSKINVSRSHCLDAVFEGCQFALSGRH